MYQKPPPAIICSEDQSLRASLPPIARGPCAAGVCCVKIPVTADWRCGQGAAVDGVMFSLPRLWRFASGSGISAVSAHLQKPRVVNRVAVAGSDQPRRTSLLCDVRTDSKNNECNCCRCCDVHCVPPCV